MTRGLRQRIAGAVLVGAIMTAMAGCVGASSTESRPVSPTSSVGDPFATASNNARVAHQVREPFSARIDRMLAHHRRTMSAAAVKLSDNESEVRNPRVRAYAASILKVAILLATEQRDRRQGHGLTSAQRSTARPMIEASDNDAATALWRDAGKGAALFRLIHHFLLMSHTRHAPALFEPWDGVTTTTTDQLRLLQALALHVRGVTDGDRHYVLHLMRHVEPDQDWGVTAGTKPGWSVAVKNGWVPVGSLGWTVNSIGIVHVPHGHDYALAILTTGSRSEAAGINKVDAIARSVARRWG